MAVEKRFRFQEMFARSAPEPQPVAQRPDGKGPRYNFSMSYPEPASLPIDDVMECLQSALADERSSRALYPHPMGYPPLREFIADKLRRDRNMRISPDDVLVSAGSGQSIHHVVEALVDPGDVVITEHFVYGGTLWSLHRFQADVRGVLCDDEGMLPEELESTVRAAVAEGKRVKLIYTIPEFQNPQGWTMTRERRLAMLRIAEQYGIPILEDDCIADLRFEGQSVDSIHALDQSGLAMYVGSFGKIIVPGFRLGYLTAPQEMMEQVMPIRGSRGVTQFAALAVHRYCVRHLSDRIAHLNNILEARRDAMLAALGENLGSVATWSRPEGGLFVWLRMPEGANLADALPMANEADLTYTPGNSFAPDGVSAGNYARLCFCHATPEENREGIARMAEVFDKAGFL